MVYQLHRLQTNLNFRNVRKHSQREADSSSILSFHHWPCWGSPAEDEGYFSGGRDDGGGGWPTEESPAPRTDSPPNPLPPPSPSPAPSPSFSSSSARRLCSSCQSSSAGDRGCFSPDSKTPAAGLRPQICFTLSCTSWVITYFIHEEQMICRAWHYILLSHHHEYIYIP